MSPEQALQVVVDTARELMAQADPLVWEESSQLESDAFDTGVLAGASVACNLLDVEPPALVEKILAERS